MTQEKLHFGWMCLVTPPQAHLHRGMQQVCLVGHQRTTCVSLDPTHFEVELSELSACRPALFSELPPPIGKHGAKL